MIRKPGYLAPGRPFLSARDHAEKEPTVRTPFATIPTLVFLFALCIARPSFAGPVTGQVVDPDGRGVPGAAIVLIDGTSIVSRAITSATGQFTLAAPDSGRYELRVALEGFRAKPMAVDGSSNEKDLGTIALQISAVSESLVVSAAQVEIPISTAASSVTVITREDLDKHQVESVTDALRTVPGLTVTSSGGRGALTSVFPRGGESDYSLVFVDGVQANAFGGGFDFAHLAVTNIERIEIVRGPQSALYGSNAIGSVIRIITRRGGAPEASALAEGGGYATSRVAAASSGEVGAWHWGASAERLASDGFTGDRAPNGAIVENDDYERNLISGTGGWRRGNTASIRGDIRYTQDERGFPGPFGSDPGLTYGGIDTVSRGTNDRLLTSIGGSFLVGPVRLNAESTHSRLDSEFVSEFFESDSYSRRTTGRVQADFTFARKLETSAGVELLAERAGGSSFQATGGVLVPVERGLAGFFGEARWNTAARLFVSAGLRVERISRRALEGNEGGFSPRPPFDDDTVVSANPKVAVAWYVRSTPDGNFTKLRGSAGTGIRPPDAFEIAFTDNPSLKPERSRSFDAGVDQALLAGRILIEGTAFFNNYDDLIVATRTFPGLSRYRTDNISNARARGFEIAGTARGRLEGLRGAGLQFRLGYTLLDTEILAVDQSRSAPPPYTVGDRLLRRPTHQFSADMLVDAGRLTAFLQGNGRSGVRDIDPTNGAPPFGAFYDAPGFNVWTLGASWRITRRLDIFGRISNLFDAEYEEAFGFPALGRSGMAGLRVAAGR
jgi:outer membrane cobalamin receptor